MHANGEVAAPDDMIGLVSAEVFVFAQPREDELPSVAASEAVEETSLAPNIDLDTVGTPPTPPPGAVALGPQDPHFYEIVLDVDDSSQSD